MLISLRGCLPHSNNLLTLRLTMHNNISKVKLSIVNKHINNSFANDKSHYNNLPRFVQTANKQYIFCNSISKVNLFQEITYVISPQSVRLLIQSKIQSKLFFFYFDFFQDQIRTYCCNDVCNQHDHEYTCKAFEHFYFCIYSCYSVHHLTSIHHSRHNLLCSCYC